MSAIIYEYPETYVLKQVIPAFSEALSPMALRVEEGDTFSGLLGKLGPLLERTGLDKNAFSPFQTIKSKSNYYGPQYKFTIDISPDSSIPGSINRRMIRVHTSESIPVELLRRFGDFAKTMEGAILTVRDHTGKQLPIEELLSAE